MRLFKHTFLLVILSLLAISAFVYLPLVGKIGFSKDDWYLTYDAHVAGPQFFHEIFSSDRPARAYLQIPLYDLFGENPLPYHLSLYIFRFIGALAFFWSLDMLWPRRRAATFGMALLFLIYPGFLSQVIPVDFQAHIFSLCLAMISIALTVKAILADRFFLKIVLTTVSITGIDLSFANGTFHRLGSVPSYVYHFIDVTKKGNQFTRAFDKGWPFMGAVSYRSCGIFDLACFHLSKPSKGN